MYTLYFLPGACSLATQTILNELNQQVELIHKNDADDYSRLNPVGTVPVLVESDRIFNEGVAILLYLLNKHDNDLLPTEATARHQAIENMLFANATMHPAYGRVFFIVNNIKSEPGKQEALTAAVSAINTLWQVVEARLQNKRYLGGDTVSPADIMLTVYSRWGDFLPVDITIGPRTRNMLNAVMARDSFQKALERENNYAANAA